jgi:hypothetical protein
MSIIVLLHLNGHLVLASLVHHLFGHQSVRLSPTVISLFSSDKDDDNFQ